MYYTVKLTWLNLCVEGLLSANVGQQYTYVRYLGNAGILEWLEVIQEIACMLGKQVKDLHLKALAIFHTELELCIDVLFHNLNNNSPTPFHVSSDDIDLDQRSATAR